MTIRSIPTDQATPQQRVDFVRNFLNLPTTGSETEVEIAAMIHRAQPGSTIIFLNEADTPDEAAAAETAQVSLKPEEQTGQQAGTLGQGDPRAVIFIPAVESEDGSGNNDVLVGVNGRGWQLKRGVDLPVPWRVVAALQNAVADVVRHRNDEGHEGEVVVTKANRFNFQFVEQPSKAEIDAWVERTGKQFCA